MNPDHIILREEAVVRTDKQLLKEKWDGVIDTVGGELLETAIKQCRYDGCVTACGNVASWKLNLSVYPFILRGVKLIGIDSAQCGGAKRTHIWDLLADKYRVKELEQFVRMITLDELVSLSKNYSGGRYVINLKE